MKVKEKLRNLYKRLDAKFLDQFGFNITNVTFDKIVDYMYVPKDSSSLAITRILFGFMMLLDIPVERASWRLEKMLKEPNKLCHFPLLPIIQPIPFPYMALVYIALCIGAIGIMLGYKFSVSGPLFATSYWYLFLIEKSVWNNHSYLFGLVAILLSCTDAACYWSIDVYLDPSKKKQTVPYWNYFILKYQFFILYFMAGLKKSGAEWLTGYSLPNLSEHWVFKPFTYFLTVSQTDFLVVHLFVFVFDLTVAMWMMWAPTRHVAMLFCALFHLMNSRLFPIGMFPWVCLATMPLFYPFDWPKRVALCFMKYYIKIHDYLHAKICVFRKKNVCLCENKTEKDTGDTYNEGNRTNLVVKNGENIDGSLASDKGEDTNLKKTIKKRKEIARSQSCELHSKEDCDSNDKYIKNEDQVVIKEPRTKIECKKKITIYLIACYVFIQAFLPYSHFITKGYNNWDEGLYGYSWNMMVHSWSSEAIAVKVVDNDKNEEMFIDHKLYTPNGRWATHGDMVYQFAHCLKQKLERDSMEAEADCGSSANRLSNNISIYVDIWMSLNGRFAQRLFNPKVDILKANWSPFSRIPYLMPLLDEALDWRQDLIDIQEEVYSWANDSDVMFYADFPGFTNEKYVPLVYKNVTLIILEGTVVYEQEVPANKIGKSFLFNTKDKIKVTPGIMHKVTNIGNKPAYYMYTFYSDNATESRKNDIASEQNLPILQELYNVLYGLYHFGFTMIRLLFEMFKFSQCN